MATIKPVIHSQLDQEPQQTDAAATEIPFALNLSIRCLVDDAPDPAHEGPLSIDGPEQLAKQYFESALAALSSADIHLYQVDVSAAGKLMWIGPAEQTVDSGEPSGGLVEWLEKQRQALHGSPAPQGVTPGSPARFWTSIAKPDSKEEVAAVSTAGAGERLRAAQAWTAPVGHRQGLTRLVHVPIDGIGQHAVVALPFAKGASPPQEIDLEVGSNGEDPVVLSYVPFADGATWTCHATTIAVDATPRTYDQFDVAGLTPEGYLQVRKGAPQLHRILRWFEERAATLLDVSAALASIGGEDDARLAALCAPRGGENQKGLDGAVWYALSRLITSLDSAVIALMQPGAQHDTPEGDILAPLVSLVIERLEDPGQVPLSDVAIDPAMVAAAIRDAFSAGSPLVNPVLQHRLLDALVFVHDIGRPARAEEPIASPAGFLFELIGQYRQGPGGTVAASLQDWLKKKSNQDVAGQVTQAVGEYEQALQDEGGLERMFLRLLRTAGFPDPANSADVPGEQGTVQVPADPSPKFADAFAALHTLDPQHPLRPKISAAFKDAWADYVALLNGPFNGHEAVRRATGACFARALLRGLDGDPDQVVDRLMATDYFRNRLFTPTPAATAAADTCFKPVHSLLVSVSTDWIPASEQDALREAWRTWLADAFVEAIAPVRDLIDPGVFVPDRHPRPLVVQVAADIDGSQTDLFAKAFNGIGVAIRRLDGPDSSSVFAHAHLADLVYDTGARIPAAVAPMMPAVSDGRGVMFIEYEGFPFADAPVDAGALDGSVGPVSPTTPFYRISPHVREPNDVHAKLPMLAYGRRFETFSFVTTNAGTLPVALQGKLPWLPRPMGSQVPAGAPSSTIAYQRTTPIAEMAVEDSAGLLGRAIPGVVPLSDDYPRAVVHAPMGSSAVYDLYRAGGCGTLPVPGKPTGKTSYRFQIADIRWDGTPTRTALQVLDRLAGTPALEIDLGASRPSHITAELLVEPIENSAPRRVLVLDGNEHPLPETLGDHCWVRLEVHAPGNEGAGLSFAVPDAESVAASSGPLLLLRPKTGPADPKLAWAAGLPTGAEFTISTPRVTYLDFERWFANPDRRAEAKQWAQFHRMLLVAYMMRHLDRRLAALIDRLPDPAVTKVRVDVALSDTLGGKDIPGDSHPLPLSALLASFLKGSELKSEWTPKDLVEILSQLDKSFRFTVTVSSGDNFRLSTNAAGYSVTLPTGTVASLSLHSLVSEAHFQSSGAHPSMFDPGIGYGASGTDQSGSKSFSAAGFRIEVMHEGIGRLLDYDGLRARQLAECMISVEAPRAARHYRLIANGDRCVAVSASPEPSVEGRHRQVIDDWRLLAEIDVVTQRWRPSGRPIYEYIRPRDFEESTSKRDPLAAVVPVHLSESGPDTGLQQARELATFEHQAFYDRPDVDAESVTQRLLPYPARTVLQEFPWDSPAAGYSRHRFILRSRYAGAMANPAKGEVAAWPQKADKVADASLVHARAWTKRVAVLADSTRLQLTRPQLRALLPLTRVPGDSELRAAPPVLAILQEPPFARGGLADRIACEIRTGFGYGFEQGAEKLSILDSRKEVGPSAHLTYAPLDAETALGTTLVAEGPMGLTFDAPNASAPAFPNAMFMLQPTTMLGDDPPLEEMMVAVAMRRYLDPHWSVGKEYGDGNTPLALDLTRAWLVEVATGSAATLPRLDIASGARRMDVLSVTSGNGKACSIHASRLLIDGDSAGIPVEIARFDKARVNALQFLHQPLGANRFAMTVLVRQAAPADVAAGRSDLPLVLTSFEWSIPDRVGTEAGTGGEPPPWMLEASSDPAPAAREVAASAATLQRWTRTGRDFSHVHVAYSKAGSQAGGRVPVRELAATIDANGSISIAHGGSTALWLCSSTFSSRVPLHVHRHTAFVTSRFLDELGRPVERYLRSRPTVPAGHRSEPSQLGATTAHPVQDQICRLVEFETPAAILCGKDFPGLPPTFRTAYFDLLSSGFAPRNGERARIRFFFRFVGGFQKPMDPKKPLGLAIWPIEKKTPPEVWELMFPQASGAASAASVLGLYVLLDLDGATTTRKYAFLMSDGSCSESEPEVWREVSLKKATPDAPGYLVRLDAPDGKEVWADVSLLHSCGPQVDESFDFDWLFSPSDSSSPQVSVGPAGLNGMVEAQARIVSVSPPIPVRVQK